MLTKITNKEMTEAVQRSGYLLEQRIFPNIEKAGFYVETNPVFPDPTTGKSREYDFSALTGIKVYQEDWDFLWVHLIGECVNNPQSIVFFSSDKVTDFLFHEDLKCSGIPLKFPWKENEDESISFQEFFHLDKFHHYCRGPFSTQYCSFQQKKGGKKEWMAWHDEAHHDLFNTLVTATEYEMDEFFSSWELPKRNEDEPLNLNVFYPLLILRGDLFECHQKRKRPIFTRRQHIQFRKSIISRKEEKTFHIDVITESFLSQYLQMIEEQHEKLKVRLRRKKKDVRKAIDVIVAEARKAKNKEKRKNFRDILEF